MVSSDKGNLSGDRLIRFHAVLDGEPGKALRNTVGLAKLRSAGAFFTGSNLAQLALSGFPPQSEKAVYYDPAAGAGDLLLAVANSFEIRPTLPETLRFWGEMLAGNDIYEEFVRATRARLAILAVSLGARWESVSSNDLKSFFPHIRRQDSLSNSNGFISADRIVMNPPFSMIDSASNSSWAKGKVTAASLFIDTAIQNASPGTRITAILPEVLRSGSRYTRWRRMVEDWTIIEKIQPYGIFDEYVDIDVFIMDLVVTGSQNSASAISWTPEQAFDTTKRVRDYFFVHVGPVVPHRDACKGPERLFIHAKSLPKWRIVNSISETRRYNGRVFEPPFVVIRRTSRPGDKNRAIGTIISGKSEVAIENHLIVLAPRDNTLSTCRSLLDRLQSDHTNLWLNQRIRCRHLTTTAVGEIPWWDSQ